MIVRLMSVIWLRFGRLVRHRMSWRDILVSVMGLTKEGGSKFT